MSEVMTILIWFHQSHYRDFKAFYTNHVLEHLSREFPDLVSYTRFVELIPGTLLPMCLYMYSRRGQQTGLIQPPFRFVITNAFVVIRPLMAWLGGVKALWAGFLASNYILSSMTKAKFWLFV